MYIYFRRLKKSIPLQPAPFVLLSVNSRSLFFKKLTGKCKNHSKKPYVFTTRGSLLASKSKAGFLLLHCCNVIFLQGALSQIIRNVYLCVCGTIKYSTFKYTGKWTGGLMIENLFHLWNSLMFLCTESPFSLEILHIDLLYTCKKIGTPCRKLGAF